VTVDFNNVVHGTNIFFKSAYVFVLLYSYNYHRLLLIPPLIDNCNSISLVLQYGNLLSAGQKLIQLQGCDISAEVLNAFRFGICHFITMT